MYALMSIPEHKQNGAKWRRKRANNCISKAMVLLLIYLATVSILWLHFALFTGIHCLGIAPASPLLVPLVEKTNVLVVAMAAI